MSTNKNLANSYFVIGSSLYMKSGNNRSKYVTVAKCLEIQGFSDCEVVKCSK